jgi:BirA family transcriptional regulator, biotin operon repressor / biotin---[acetyl-CoA-carboxylase] ligase
MKLESGQELANHNSTMNTGMENCIRALASGGRAVASNELAKTLADSGLSFKEMAGMIALSEPLELLDRDLIMRQISSRPELGIHWAIDSTNNYLLEARTGKGPVSVCLAEQQLAGKGRRGRTWVSPFGKNIYMSVGRDFDSGPGDLAGLSLVAGIQVIKSLHACGIHEAGLKWPNDVMAGKGKLAGILVELKSLARNCVFAVVGVGVNISMQEKYGRVIDQPFSVVSEYSSVSRNEMAGNLLENLLQAMALFEIEGFSAFHREWRQFDLYKDQEVVVHRGFERIEGRDVGVDDDGNLLLETAEGIVAFNSGEVSLRTRV